MALPWPALAGASHSSCSATSARSANRSASMPRAPGQGRSPGASTLRRRSSNGSSPRRAGGFVDLRLAGQRHLRSAEAAERAGGRRVRVDDLAGDVEGRDAVRAAEAVGRLAPHERRVLGVGAGVERDRRPAAQDRPVAGEGGAQVDRGGVAARRQDRLLHAQRQPHGPAGPQGKRRRERLDLGVRLAAVAAADVRDDDAHLRERQAEAPGQVVADHVGVLGGGPDRQPTARPRPRRPCTAPWRRRRTWDSGTRPRPRGRPGRRPPRCRPTAGATSSRRWGGRARCPPRSRDGGAAPRAARGGSARRRRAPPPPSARTAAAPGRP